MMTLMKGIYNSFHLNYAHSLESSVTQIAEYSDPPSFGAIRVERITAIGLESLELGNAHML